MHYSILSCSYCSFIVFFYVCTCIMHTQKQIYLFLCPSFCIKVDLIDTYSGTINEIPFTELPLSTDGCPPKKLKKSRSPASQERTLHESSPSHAPTSRLGTAISNSASPGWHAFMSHFYCDDVTRILHFQVKMVDANPSKKKSAHPKLLGLSEAKLRY